MEQQLKFSSEQIDELRNEIEHFKLHAANSTQHWNTIELLFGERKQILSPNMSVANKESQTQIGLLFLLQLQTGKSENFLFIREYRQMHKY